MTYPLMSVAIPAYNHSAFIEACLASVCAQTYPELELVLIDDGSRDDTFAKAEAFLARHPDRFRRVVLKRQENQGVSATSNACIEACQGEWVHLLGSDDILYPDKAMTIHQAIASWNCPELALVHADVDYVDETGRTVTRKRQPARPAPGPDFHAYRWLFAGKHYVFNPTITLRRDAILAVGGFDKTLPLEDLDCWLRLSTRYAVARVPEVLAGYRKHPGNASRKRLKMLGAQFQTYAKFLSRHPGLIEAGDLRRHFRQNLRRVWRRMKTHRPALLPKVAWDALCSWGRTPAAQDYAYYAEKLKEGQGGQ
ncbi:glycosyltransferase family 2 protein [Methylogaea oryzae]|uniref:Alpha-1,3-rhamnosyltransferase WapR n=1 Tax=Methylogaea oryzae TaxID=1295382 RepID=A0A8D5AID5_9GAMM|nr:glycosyltransferase [Methylogaea oryzae]BBL69629.1 alpha-1,3-rhamnosyltransferase WapR [Methylogaea oryzae]